MAEINYETTRILVIEDEIHIRKIRGGPQNPDRMLSWS
jgi:hypothetical protein